MAIAPIYVHCTVRTECGTYSSYVYLTGTPYHVTYQYSSIRTYVPVKSYCTYIRSIQQIFYSFLSIVITATTRTTNNEHYSTMGTKGNTQCRGTALPGVSASVQEREYDLKICSLEDIQQTAKKKLPLDLYEYIASG